MKFSAFILFAILIFFFSCNDHEKIAALQLREEKLAEREKEFSLKEADYINLLKIRDSLKNDKDSTNQIAVPEYILGKWNGRMICTESSCPENMIGDQRSDTWEFYENGTDISAKVTNKTGGTRIYTGIYTGVELKLKFRSDSSAAKKTEINIVLKETQNNRMKGIREIIGENNCVSVFAVDMEKSKN